MPPRRPAATATAGAPDPAPIPHRWTPFGLEDDPFFQEELGPRPTDAHPVACYFVGREDDVLVTTRVLRPTYDDHTGRYHAVSGRVSVALEAALTA